MDKRQYCVNREGNLGSVSAAGAVFGGGCLMRQHEKQISLSDMGCSMAEWDI